MTNRTFTIIKPNAVEAGNTGRIISMLEDNGFRISAMQMVRMSDQQAARFYDIHRDKPFYGRLLDFMTSGRSVVAVLEKEDAVHALRELVGNTDPAQAAEGTVRRLYGEDNTRNAIHASDSDQNAYAEMVQFFSDNDLL